MEFPHGGCSLLGCRVCRMTALEVLEAPPLLTLFVLMDAQARIAARIAEEHVAHNYEQAMEHNPEVRDIE